MLESVQPLLDRWYVFLPLAAAVALFYILEYAVKSRVLKAVFNVLNLLTHAAVFFFCIFFDTGIEIALLMILVCILIGFLTEGGRKNGI